MMSSSIEEEDEEPVAPLKTPKEDSKLWNAFQTS